MENRHKIEFGVAVLVIIGLVVLLFVLWKGKEPEKVDDTTVPVADDGTDVSPVASEDVPSNPVVSARTVATNFVERFGSYSTDADYQNIDDVMALATDSLQRRLTDMSEEARRTKSDDFYGVSTHALIFTAESEAAASMTWRITTQREESIGSRANTSVRNQDIRVSMIKIGDDWLVDDFAWLE